MKNNYWTNRHYDYTNNIKEAVKGMNEDIKELSKCCDMLEEQLCKEENIIHKLEKYLEQRKEEFNNCRNKEYISSYHYIMLIKDSLKILKGDGSNEKTTDNSI